MTVKRKTKAQIITELAERTELSKKDVTMFLTTLQEMIVSELSGRGAAGEFVLPDLVKLKLKKTPAQKNKKFRNPGTGEEFFKDVPASVKVRATPLKKLKDAVM